MEINLPNFELLFSYLQNSSQWFQASLPLENPGGLASESDLDPMTVTNEQR